MLINKEGSIMANGIEYALKLEEVEDKPLVTHKILVYLKTALDIQYKEQIDNGKRNNT